MKAVLFINPQKKHAKKLKQEIKEEFSANKIDTDCFTISQKPLLCSKTKYSLAISLGGDGTVLFAARTMAALGVPVFPVNLGTFGFIAGIKPSEWRETFALWQKGKALLSRRLMLEVSVERGGREIFRCCCLNDAVISSSGISKIINLQLSVGSIKLGTYRSDGIIVSTPTGSTAHSLAAGGPIVDPELETMIVNPICPFTLSQRPMVIPTNEALLIELERQKKISVCLTADGQVTEKLKSGDRVFVKKAPYHCQLISSGRYVFYDALRKKLAHSGRGGEEAK